MFPLSFLFSPLTISCEIGRCLCRNLHKSRCLLLDYTHYDTLKVKKDCTSKEIKDAFIKLSKQCHPDKNQNNPENHDMFVKLNEAYSILSKPGKRYNYDLSLAQPSTFSQTGDVNVSHDSEKRPFQDETLWENRDKSQDKAYSAKPYYGIVGLKKLPNSWVVAFCIFFSLVGLGLQMLAISKSAAFKREQLDEVSIRNSLLHSYVREQAKNNGNEMQIKLVHKRLLNNKATTDESNVAE